MSAQPIGQHDTDLCLDLGQTDDGKRWACTLHGGHDSYWFEHQAMTGDRDRPVVTWWKHDGHRARYLVAVERVDSEEDQRRAMVELAAVRASVAEVIA